MKSNKFLFVILFLAPCLFSPAFGQDWVITTVDYLGDVGQYSSIALGQDQNPRISYYDENNHKLKLATFSGGNWSTQDIDTEGDVGQWSALVANPQNQSQFAYYDADRGALKYAGWVDYAWEWSTETVDPNTSVGEYSSIALKSNGYPTISYYDEANSRLKTASTDNGVNWSLSVVDEEGQVGKYSSLGIDASDNKIIAYYDEDRGALKYAGWVDFAWNWATGTIDDNTSVGKYSSIALKVNSFPTISYFDENNTRLKTASTDNGVNWSLSVVDEEGRVGKYSVLGIDASDNKSIAYYDEDRGALKYAGWVDFAWNWATSTVDNSAFVGEHSSIALKTNGHPTISYYDENNSRLKTASTNEGVTWVLSEIDNDGQVGKYSSLGIDASDNNNIAYYDEDRGALKYAGWVDVAWDWATEIADDAGQVGGYTSCIIDNEDIFCVSYYDFDQQALKFARKTISGWEREFVDNPSQNVGISSALAKDNYGDYGIVYIDDTQHWVKLAEYGQQWLPADFNHDGRVDGFDLAILAASFGYELGDPNYNPIVDLNSSGRVDGFDLAIFCTYFGEGCIIDGYGGIALREPVSKDMINESQLSRLNYQIDYTGYPDAYLSMELESEIIRAGDILRITISLENAVNTFGIALDLNFDPEVFNIINVKDLGLFSNDGVQSISLNQIDNETGQAIIGIVRQSSSSGGIDCDGEILEINLVAEETVQNVELAFSNVALFAPDGLTNYPIICQGVGVKIEEALPTKYALLQNHPNPFNSSTTFTYQIPKGMNQFVTLKIYNILGEEVAVLVNDFKEPGTYLMTWNGLSNKGGSCTSGLYFYRLHAGSYIKTKKMIIMK